jgi:DNA-binding MarR family transcriptional regulator
LKNETGKAAEPQYLIVSLASQLVRLGGQFLEKKLLPQGVTLQEFRIAGLLIDEHGITQKDLAEKLSVTPATLSVAISKLERRGMVVRNPGKTDRRVNYLHLTPNSNVSEMITTLYKFEEDISQGISAVELQTTRKVIGLLLNNLARL